jgi:hypothetical protein
MQVTKWPLDYDDPSVRHYCRDPDPTLVRPLLSECDRVVTNGQTFHRLRNETDVLAVYDEFDRRVSSFMRPDLYEDDRSLLQTTRW